jgi:transposase
MCHVHDELIIPSYMLGIPNIDIIEIHIENDINLIVDVESRDVATRCYQCGRQTYATDGHDKPITLRHLSMFSYECYIRIHPIRCKCTCGTITIQKSTWHTQRSSCTTLYEDHILRQLINSTISDVSIKENIGYDVVKGILERRIDTDIDWDQINKIDILGIDEIALKKGHRDFVAIVSGYSEGQLFILGVLKDREKSTVKAFFQGMPARLRQQVKVVCVDLYEGFINASKEVFSNKVNITADRFHVAKLYRKKVDNLRVKEMKRLKGELPEESYQELQGSMWILRKRASELDEDEKKTLNLLFTYSADLKLAYQYSNDLTAIFDSNISKFQAKHKLNAWMNSVKSSGLKCFNSFIKTLSKFKDEISNYFIDRHSSGFVEGLNNKIKSIKRRCYGIFNIQRLFQHIRLDTSGYALFARGMRRA